MMNKVKNKYLKKFLKWALIIIGAGTVFTSTYMLLESTVGRVADKRNEVAYAHNNFITASALYGAEYKEGSYEKEDFDRWVDSNLTNIKLLKNNDEKLQRYKDLTNTIIKPAEKNLNELILSYSNEAKNKQLFLNKYLEESQGKDIDGRFSVLMHLKEQNL